MEDGTTAGGYVRDVIERVTPRVLAARAAGYAEDADFITEHIRHTVDLLLDRSRLLADAADTGKVALVGLSDGTAHLVTARSIDVCPHLLTRFSRWTAARAGRAARARRMRCRTARPSRFMTRRARRASSESRTSSAVDVASTG